MSSAPTVPFETLPVRIMTYATQALAAAIIISACS
jgi:hypothetical protein